MPVADAFNFLLAGVPCVEMSLASTTQLFNPLTRSWSQTLLNALRLPAKLLPPVVKSGTELGPLRPEIAKDTHLEDALVMTSCSHQLAAALVGLPIPSNETWAYLCLGSSAAIGVEVPQPIITDASREWNFTNEIGYNGTVRFQKPATGLFILEECRRFWGDENRELDGDLLVHLAGSAPPFASLINPDDPRFSEPGDMPLKIQAFCRETRQPMPRKPGAIFRCILESLALNYRKTLREIEALTGNEVKGLCVLGGSANNLLNHFTASAIEIPIVIAPEDAAVVGNIIVQALALGHIPSLPEARNVVRNSCKIETIIPRATAWDVAYDRLLALYPSS
jgi:rhamnulokinase